MTLFRTFAEETTSSVPFSRLRFRSFNHALDCPSKGTSVQIRIAVDLIFYRGKQLEQEVGLY
jgi:hypothetical protein